MDELIVTLISWFFLYSKYRIPFPEGTHVGCSFHYGMTLNRNQDGLLRDVIAEEPEVGTWFRRLQALVFFPKVANLIISQKRVTLGLHSTHRSSSAPRRCKQGRPPIDLEVFPLLQNELAAGLLCGYVE